MPRPRYDWSLALMKGVNSAIKIGTTGSVVSGAITKQWLLMVSVNMGTAFLAGVSTDLDGYFQQVKAWDVANATPPPGVT